MIVAAALAAVTLLSGRDAYRMGLEQVCIPIVNGRDATVVAGDLHLQPLPDNLLPNRTAPGDRGWYLPTRDITLAVAWADGSCSVQMVQGDIASLHGLMEQVLRPRPEQFKPGRVDAPAPGLRRVVYCEAKRPHPLMVTIASPAPGTPNRMISSSTVLRSKEPGEPPSCVFNGAG